MATFVLLFLLYFYDNQNTIDALVSFSHQKNIECFPGSDLRYYGLHLSSFMSIMNKLMIMNITTYTPGTRPVNLQIF